MNSERLTLELPTRIIFDPVLHSTVVEKSKCLLLSMNISTGPVEIFIANKTPWAVVHSINLISITSNVTELLSKHFQAWRSYILVAWAHILPRDISFENRISKLSLVKISCEITFKWFRSELFIENHFLEECPSYQSSTYNSGWLCLI